MIPFISFLTQLRCAFAHTSFFVPKVTNLANFGPLADALTFIPVPILIFVADQTCIANALAVYWVPLLQFGADYQFRAHALAEVEIEKAWGFALDRLLAFA